MVIIKRYPNRKLYNTETKKYITLDGIADLIREGEEVQVLDHATGEDLTALSLSQILFEREKKSAGFLPHSVHRSWQAGWWLWRRWRGCAGVVVRWWRVRWRCVEWWTSGRRAGRSRCARCRPGGCRCAWTARPGSTPTRCAVHGSSHLDDRVQPVQTMSP